MVGLNISPDASGFIYKPSYSPHSINTNVSGNHFQRPTSFKMKIIDNLDSLLLSDNLNNSLIEIDNFVCELCKWGDKLDALTEAQKNFYYNQNLEREINNGGFNQYFINSSGDFAHETISSLGTIGADHTAEILQSAIDEFPDKKVPRDRDERIRIVEDIEETANEKWEELDQKFFEYKDNLNSLNIDFIKRHRTEF
jgi:hypothetical protein